MSEIDISKWYSDIESATDCMCEMMMEDFETKKDVFDYVVKHSLDAEVSEWVLGASCASDYVIEMYEAVAKESKKWFEIKLLGTY
jgi:hypothetical protein